MSSSLRDSAATDRAERHHDPAHARTGESGADKMVDELLDVSAVQVRDPDAADRGVDVPIEVGFVLAKNGGLVPGTIGLEDLACLCLANPRLRMSLLAIAELHRYRVVFENWNEETHETEIMAQRS